MRLLLCLTLAVPLCAQLQFLNPQSDWSIGNPVVATDAAGNTYVVDNTQNSLAARQGITATKLDASHSVVYRYSFGGSRTDVPMAVAVDSSGSLYISGWTSSSDFPVVNPLMKPIANGQFQLGFLSKLDPQGTRLVFSTLLGGQDTSGYTSQANALTVDGSGNIYVAGATTSRTFPVSLHAFQTTGGGLNSQTIISGFLMKINAANNAILYSTYLGGQTAVCGDPGLCYPATAQAYAIAVDAQGIATVAGYSIEKDFPTSASAYQTTCSSPDGNVFIARFNADASALQWSTLLCSTFTVSPQIGLALDSHGDALVASTTSSTTFATTSGALQPLYPGGPPVPGTISPPTTGYLALISNDGSSLLHATYFGGSTPSRLGGFVIDAAGNPWITGQATSGDLPVPPGTLVDGTDYLVQLDPTLSHVQQYFGLPDGAAALTLNMSNQNLVLTGAANSVVTVPIVGPQGPSVVGFAGAAMQIVSRNIAPGEVVSIYGANLASVHHVLFNGVSAPILYAGANQINCVVPFAVAVASDVTLQVGSTQPVTGLVVTQAMPQIFPVIVNQDGTINSQDHRAPRNSIVTMWATGTGMMDTGNSDGAINQPPLGTPLLPLGVQLSRLSPPDSGVITYGGAAPGMVAGVSQINFQVPPYHTGYGTCHYACKVILSVGYQRSLAPDLLLWVPD